MPSNANAIFTKNVKNRSSSSPVAPGVVLTTGNTSSQGGGTIGTDIFLVCSADATNGSFIRRIRLIPTATLPTTTTATVARFFISTKSSGATTQADTFLVGEVTLPAIAADNSTTAVYFFDFPFNDGLEAGMHLLATTHVTPAANTDWVAVPFYGDF